MAKTVSAPPPPFCQGKTALAPSSSFVTPLPVINDRSLMAFCLLPQGAFWGILAGHVCGIIRLVLDLTYPAPSCGDPDTRPAVVSKLHYTYFGQINLIFTAIVCVCVSLMTKPLDEEKVRILSNDIGGSSPTP